MKVLLFVRSLAVGGTERQVVALALGLAERGHEVTLVQLYSGGVLEVPLRDSAVKLLSVEKKGRWDVLGPLCRLRQVFRSELPDLIYSFLPMQNVLAALLIPAVKPTRLVFGARASGMDMQHYDRLSALSYRAEAALSTRADLIVANAECFRSDAAARGFRNSRIAVVANGIDTRSMRPDPAARHALRQAWGIADDATVIGMVARLDPMKDHANFLAAAAEFIRHRPGARFVCIGGGATAHYQDELDALTRHLGLDGRVIFAGERKDVGAIYNAFDIATLSSAFGEGFPNVIGEAMACGVPVAATDVGEARNIVGQYGIVVMPRRPDLLCAAWTELRQRLASDRELGMSARAHIVKNFGVEAMVERTEAVLKQVCGVAPH